MDRTCRIKDWARRWARDEEGATATEYAIMLALILMACIGAIQVYGTGLSNLFVSIQTSLFAA